MTQRPLQLTGGFDAGPLFQHGAMLKKAAKVWRSGGQRVWHFYRRARPAWADIGAINAMWRLSKEITAATGVQHSVDHIVPLSHPLVCGLHVEHNLCIRPLADNIRKSNRYWPDMWGEQEELWNS